MNGLISEIAWLLMLGVSIIGLKHLKHLAFAMDRLSENIEKRLNDHESRLRNLENRGDR